MISHEQTPKILVATSYFLVLYRGLSTSGTCTLMYVLSNAPSSSINLFEHKKYDIIWFLKQFSFSSMQFLITGSGVLKIFSNRKIAFKTKAKYLLIVSPERRNLL